ncbi:hypothetical protein BH18ACT14_BH18ACT14_13630 [soil metagenome]
MLAFLPHGRGRESRAQAAGISVVLELGRGACGIYNIVDDEPAPVREYLPVLAATIGAGSPLGIRSS